MKKSTPGKTRGACSVIRKGLLGSLDDVQRGDGVIIILGEQNGHVLVSVGGVVAVDGAGGDVTVGVNNIHDHVIGVGIGLITNLDDLVLGLAEVTRDRDIVLILTHFSSSQLGIHVVAVLGSGIKQLSVGLNLGGGIITGSYTGTGESGDLA